MDRQYTLGRGSADEARASVQRVVDALYMPEGGVIAQFELTAGSKMANADAIFQAWADMTSQPT